MPRGNEMPSEAEESVSSALASARALMTALSVATGVLVLVLAGLAWNGVTSVRRLQDANGRHVRLDQLHGTIVHLDEVLTMSARMCAATGDPQWETRYRTFEPILSRAIEEAQSLASHAWAADDVGRTEAANTALVQLENEAFALVRQNHLEAARATLSSGEYERQKRIYSAGMDDLDAALDRAAQEAMQGASPWIRIRCTGSLRASSLHPAAERSRHHVPHKPARACHQAQRQTETCPRPRRPARRLRVDPGLSLAPERRRSPQPCLWGAFPQAVPGRSSV